MKISFYHILALTILAGCFQGKSIEGSEDTRDTTIVFKTLGEEEQYMWDYFRKFEAQLENDPEIKKENIPKIIQILIDEGDLETPIVYIETEKGTEAKNVDYLTYKEFRKNNPIDLQRQYVVSLASYIRQDSLNELNLDSTRTNLLNELKPDSVTIVQ